VKLVIVGNGDSLDKCLVFLDDEDNEQEALEIARNERYQGDIDTVVQLTPHQSAQLEEVVYCRIPYMG
jgi:hypothetical protein